MSKTEEILRLKIKPKEKQTRLIEAIVSGQIPAKEFIDYFRSGSDVDKGSCADAMKHVSAEHPEILAPYIDVLIEYINYKAPRVKWGVPETIGNLARKYPEKAKEAVPYLLKNTSDDKINTTVIRWCAAFALAHIAEHSPKTRRQLVPFFQNKTKEEKNSGVKNVYAKALKSIASQ